MSRMPLTRVEKERITDSRLKLQSVARSLKHVNPKKLKKMEEIQECLENAEETLGGALRSTNDTDTPTK